MGISRFRQWLFTPQWVAKQDTSRATSLGVVMIPIYGGQPADTTAPTREVHDFNAAKESVEADAAAPIPTSMTKEG